MSVNNFVRNQRKRHSNVDAYFAVQPKIARGITTNDSHSKMTCIEDLPNEIFYEIFDYLDGCEVFNTLSNINQRFQKLLMHSQLPIKIQSSCWSTPILNDSSQVFISAYNNRILSFHIDSVVKYTPYYEQVFINSSFNRLESIILQNIDNLILRRMLEQLTKLPRLYSLSIYNYHHFNINIAEIIQLTFRLKCLKYLKILIDTWLPINSRLLSNNAVNSLEKLVIGWHTNAEELTRILPSVPQLKHLTCYKLSSGNSTTGGVRIQMNKLQSVCIRNCKLTMDEFEMFVEKFLSIVRCLKLDGVTDQMYLDTVRWEMLIRRHMRNLEQLKVKNSTYNTMLSIPEAIQLNLNRFNSLFWVQRQLLLRVDASFCPLNQSTINWSIQPYKRAWYQFPGVLKQSNNSNLCLNLQINNLFGFDGFIFIRNQFKNCNCSIQFTSLHINLTYFSASIIIKCLGLLPHIDSLTIASQFPSSIKDLFEQSRIIRNAATKNKITKVNIEQLSELDQIPFILELCSSMRYLQVKCRNINDASWLIQYIVNKKKVNFISHLHTLCIWIDSANGQIMDDFKKIIQILNSVQIFTSIHVDDKIFFQWND